MPAETLPDAGPCRVRGCGDPQWSHKRGKLGCKECGCGKYLPPSPPAGTVEADPASPVPGVVEERPDGPDLGVCVGGPLPAEPGDVELPVRRRRRRGPSGTVVATDPAAQAASLRLVAEIDAQLAKPIPPPAIPPPPDLAGEQARVALAHDKLSELRADLAEERREHQATALLLAEQRHLAERVAEQHREVMRELGRERTAHRDTRQELADARRFGRDRTAELVAAQKRIAELEATVARMVRHFESAAAADPARVLMRYEADHCERCGFRTTVPELQHHHPLTPVTVLVVERTPTAEADAEATDPTKE